MEIKVTERDRLGERRIKRRDKEKKEDISCINVSLSYYLMWELYILMILWMFMIDYSYLYLFTIINNNPSINFTIKLTLKENLNQAKKFKKKNNDVLHNNKKVWKLTLIPIERFILEYLLYLVQLIYAKYNHTYNVKSNTYLELKMMMSL